jgi:hypothetical protein
LIRHHVSVSVNTNVEESCVSSLQLDVGCPVVIAVDIPDVMLLPTDECFAQKVPEHVYDGLRDTKIQPIPQGTASQLTLTVEAQ